jgi:hypothetical protein
MLDSLILDENLEAGTSKLSNYQLIGITVTKVKYPVSIINQVHTEIEKRNLNPIVIKELKNEYISEKIVQKVSITKLQTVCIILIIGLLIKTISFSELIILSVLSTILKFTILLLPILAVQTRFKKGISAEKYIWKIANFIIIIFIIISLIIPLITF